VSKDAAELASVIHNFPTGLDIARPALPERSADRWLANNDKTDDQKRNLPAK
jgi:hypothetical protein